MLFEDDDEELTAYHEAGHVVLVLATGGMVVHASLEPPADDGPARYGETISRWESIDAATSNLNELRVSLAGPIAEMLYRNEAMELLDDPAWRADLDRAYQAAACLTTRTRAADQLIQRETIALRDWLDREPAWSALASIADLLLAHQTIDHEMCADHVEFWFRQ